MYIDFSWPDCPNSTIPTVLTLLIDLIMSKEKMNLVWMLDTDNDVN